MTQGWERLVSWRSRRAHATMCILIIAIAAAYIGPLVLRGWIPHDEGTLSQSAHRVLMGQLPHRDFDELYTGGLSFLHAGAFLLWGEKLSSLRYVLFVAVVLAMPVYYYVASRFAPPIAAFALSVCALGWSFGNYPASIPSWYSFIFALLGCACLLRYLETNARRWIFGAGLCGGLSVVVKIVGLYFIAAAVLFLVFHASTIAVSERRATWRATAGFLLLILGSIILTMAPALIMGTTARLSQLVGLALPAIATGFVTMIVLVRSDFRKSDARWLVFASNALPLALGAIVPLAALAAPYIQSDALEALLRGVFVLPRRRLLMASDVGPDLILFALALLPLWLLISPRLSIDVFRRIGPLGVAAISLGLVGWAAIDIRVFNVLWLSVRMTAPAVLIFGSMLLVPSRQAAHRSSVHRLRFVALVCTTAWCGLIQFPFTPPLYFCFIAPLAVLSIYAVVDNRGEPSINFALPAIFACAAVGFMARQALFVEYIPRVVLKNTSTALLDLPRGGLTVRKKDRDRYVLMADLVTRHAGSTFIYATPDSPEIYFLTERENPTRTFFEFFDDTAGRDGRTLATLRDRDVRLVIINRFPSTSPLISKSLYDSLMVRYPFQADLDVYEVRWRE